MRKKLRMGTTAQDLMERDDSEGEEDEEDKKQIQLNEDHDTLRKNILRDAVDVVDMQRCRICAKIMPTGEAVARIFGDEDKRRNLQRNIQKYLYITVSSEDKLPKIVCASCTGKLDGIHAFATMALKSQEKLKHELIKMSMNSTVTVDSSDSCDSSANKLGERGLLHSILTKGSTDLSNGGELIQGRQRAPSTEEMEVKIDPMLFLQCALEQPSSADYSDYSDDSDKEDNSYCSPVSEPLQLTKNRLNGKNQKDRMAEVEIPKNRDNNDNEDYDNNIDDDKYNENDDEAEFEDDEDFDNTKLKSHVCKICAKAFVSQIALQNHLWSHLPTTTNSDIHGYIDKPPNSRNERLFDSSNGISQNNSCSENNLLNGNFICPICGKKISTKGNLKVHLETHRPKGKYGCDICGRIFKTQSNLFRHKEYHSGIQFPCSVCGRVYPTNSTLRAHSITHSDLRPHACPLCDKTFKRNQDLKFHINQHTGARPYQCPYCPKAFASSGNCFSHRKRMHPKEVHRDRQRAADLMR